MDDRMGTIAAADYKRTTMAVLAYEGVRPFQLSVPCEIFGEVHCEGVDPELWVCALKPGLLRTSSGFSVGTTHSLADVPRATWSLFRAGGFPISLRRQSSSTPL